MSNKMGFAIATFAFAAASATSTSAHAQMVPVTQQPTPYSEQMPRGTVMAPSNAFEIQLSTGYAQGFGPRIAASGDLPSTSVERPGMGAGLGLAYRATPRASVGVVGSYSMQDTAKGAQLRNATASLDATYHANPFQRLDPFVSIGAGYRMMWDKPINGRETFTHGFQLARAAVGLDVRLNKDIAIAPMVGGDVDMFLWRSSSGYSTAMIENPTVNGYLFAGVAGRFDMGGNRQGPPSSNVGLR
jgi:outer membrane protein W